MVWFGVMTTLDAVFILIIYVAEKCQRQSGTNGLHDGSVSTETGGFLFRFMASGKGRMSRGFDSRSGVSL